MRKVLTLALREYLASVRTKGFIIGLVLTPILMGSGLIAIKLSQKMADVTDRTIVVVDRSGLVADAIVAAADERNAKSLLDGSGKKVLPAYRIEVVAPDTTDPAGQRLTLSNRIRSKSISAFVEIGEGVLHPSANNREDGISFYSRNAMLDDARSWMSWPVNNRLRHLRLEAAGIDESKVRDLFSNASLDPMEPVSVNRGTGRADIRTRSSEKTIIIPMVAVILMFMLIQMGSNPLIATVIEEKNQRIAEVMLGSVRPFEFMMGKVLGGVFVAVTASLVYIGGGVTLFLYTGMAGEIPFHLFPWFFSFLVLAVFMFGSMYAALGSACSDIKDVQSLVMPAMLLMIVPMLVLMPVIRDPLSPFATGLSLFPPFTPALMMLRLACSGGIPAWQPFAGMAGVLATALLAIWIGGRIFRIGILMQGKPPRIDELFRWAFRG
jgi:ABC-2 type transport system permease protein